MDSKVAELPLTDKLFAWFETNKRQALMFVVAAAVVALVAWFVLWQKEEKANTASDALSSVLVAQLSGTAARMETSESAEEYLKIAAAYPKSSAGARALLLAGGNYFLAARYPEAQAQFERLVREYPNSPFRPQALLGIAVSFDAQGKTDQAITAYKELTSRYSSESIVTQAKFSLACLYESQQKLELARDLFGEVEREDRMGSYGVDAGMRLEALFAKNPKLAPSTQGPGKATLQLEGK